MDNMPTIQKPPDNHIPEKKPKETEALTVTFMTDGIKNAIAKAKAAAGEKNVILIGASTNQQVINAVAGQDQQRLFRS